MTLPDERYRSIKWTKQFLHDLLDPKKTPRIPKEIRQQAYSCLRHFPDDYHLDLMATRCPNVLQTNNPVDPIVELILDYESKSIDQK